MSANCQIAVRSRPLNDRDRGSLSCLSFNGKNVVLKQSKSGQQQNYALDHAFDMGTAQEQVYNSMGGRLLDKAFDGYNGAIVLFGQGGSGKSHTLYGEAGKPGMVAMFSRDIWQRIAASSPTMRHLLSVSFVQVHDDHVYDLLNPTSEPLMVRQHPTYGAYCDNVAEIVAKGDEDLVRLIQEGLRIKELIGIRLQLEAAKVHTILTIRIDARDITSAKKKPISSKLVFADLAGTTIADHGGADRNAVSFAKVIEMLSDPKHKHNASFRDSKLTRLLQESLGGNSFTMLFGHVSPADTSSKESQETLHLLQRGGNIQCQIHKNEDDSEKTMRVLREQIDTLRVSLVTPSGEDVDMEKMAQMEQLLRDLDMVKRMGWEEKVKISKHYEKARRQNMEQENILDIVTQAGASRISNDKLQSLQRERQTLMKQYKEQRGEMLRLQRALDDDVSQFTRLNNEGKLSDGDKAIRMRKIDNRRSTLKDLKDKVDGFKSQLKENVEAEVQEDGAAGASVDETSRMWSSNQESHRFRMREEHDKILSAERRRLEDEKNRERDSIRNEAAKRKTGVSAEEFAQLQTQLMQERHDKQLLMVKLDLLKSENDLFLNQLEENDLRHEHELEQQQLQDLKIFRAYREQFEEDKKKMEKAYRKLVESSVSDLVYLTTRNEELDHELKQFRPKTSFADSKPDKKPGWRI